MPCLRLAACPNLRCKVDLSISNWKIFGSL
jgi:hypothetical protein